MTSKSFINELNNEIDSITPNNSFKVLSKINRKRKTKKKRILAISLSSLLVPALILIIILSLKPKATIVESYSDDLNKSYAQSIASVAYSLPKKKGVKNAKKNSNEIVEEISEYYLLLESFVNREDISFTVKESNVEGYKYDMNVFLKIQGVSSDYKISYNVQNEFIKQNKKYYSFYGNININNSEFKIEGSTKEKNDEILTIIKIYYSNNEYYIIEQELENDEISYEYTYYLNNKLVYEYEFEIDYESSTPSFSLEFKEGKSKGEVEAKKQEDYVLLEVEIESYEGLIKVYHINNQLKFIIENEEIIKNL